MSKEFSTHSADQKRVIVEPSQGSNEPSNIVAPTRSDSPLQEAATQQTTDSVQQKVPFKEQVIAVAQKTRGTLLGKPALKEHGEAILQGRTTHEQDRR